ncbi:MAG: tetratricopeptide repeat protein, partial [Acidobacteria bacterium]|nr:tetratricopeptide repeat protein [Acidobacteriota bacterium]
MDQAAANVLVEEADAALAAGDLDEAVGLYRAAIDRFPAYASFEL